MTENTLGQIIQLDRTTSEWFNKHPDVQTTVTQCKKCGLWHKSSLGHDCLRDGITTIKEKTNVT